MNENTKKGLFNYIHIQKFANYYFKHHQPIIIHNIEISFFLMNYSAPNFKFKK